ncbi:hypothetical protein SNEBB_008514 [Seison nebaliae]|nr:hypothetical protein SNEBB_008514 [Seison nebaliae]
MNTCPDKRFTGNTTGTIKDEELSYILFKALFDANSGTTRDVMKLAENECVNKENTAEKKKELCYMPNELSSYSAKYLPTYFPPYVHLNTVISDLVTATAEFMEMPELNFRSVYYPMLRVFNLELGLNRMKSDGIKTIKFYRDYYDQIGQHTMGPLRHYIIDKKIKPKTIQISFRESIILRIHERTYPSFVAFINTFILDGIEASPIPDFKVFLETPRFTMPSLTENSIIGYPFPSDQGDTFYPMIGMTFRISEQFEYQMGATNTLMVESDVLLCVEKIRIITKRYFKTPAESEFLDLYVRKYVGYFQSLCAKIFLSFAEYNIDVNQEKKFHRFAVTNLLGKWRLMDDQYSFVVGDIQTVFSYMENLVIDSVLLENNDIDVNKSNI